MKGRAVTPAGGAPLLDNCYSKSLINTPQVKTMEVRQSCPNWLVFTIQATYVNKTALKYTPKE